MIGGKQTYSLPLGGVNTLWPPAKTSPPPVFCFPQHSKPRPKGEDVVMWEWHEMQMVVSINLHWNRPTAVYLCIVCGYFLDTNSRVLNSVLITETIGPCKAWNISANRLLVESKYSDSGPLVRARVYFSLSLFFLRFYLIYLRERDHECGGGAEREADPLLSREPESGLHPRSPGSRPEPKADAQLLSHPDGPKHSFFNEIE